MKHTASPRGATHALAIKQPIAVIHDDGRNVYQYRLTRTGHSSARFGVCEVCGEHVSETHIQTRFMLYESSIRHVADLGPFGWTHQSMTFGHRECLETCRVGELVTHIQPDGEAEAWQCVIEGVPAEIRPSSQGFAVTAAGATLARERRVSHALRRATVVLSGGTQPTDKHEAGTGGI